MAAPSINLSNIESCLCSFNDELKNCNTKFENFQDILFSLRSDFRSKRSEFKDTLKELHYDLLRELKRVDQFAIDKEYHENKCKFKRDEFNKVLVESRRALDKMVTDFDDLNVDINSQIKNFDIEKENSLPRAEESINKPTNKVNEFVLHSRQTEEPFKLMAMKTGFRHKCSGCNQNIHIQSLYLSHIEEYPAGSKTFIPHSYHITASCIFQRGFEVNYLKNISVSSDKPINNDIINILKEIGFKKKNIQLDVSKINDCYNKEANSSDDFPDNASEASDMSSNPSVASSNTATLRFIYRTKHPNQKKAIQCQGCKLNIETETYITFENEKQLFLPFHIKKPCLKEIISDDFNQATCKVYKLLKSYSQLQELMTCGFLYKKIFGYRPSNPTIKRSDKNKVKGNKEDNSDCAYIFNEEPFILERLSHGEKCKGCQNLVKRDVLSLRHKERVPRDKLDYSPLISQYYHANKQCLLERGFTIKYLSFIKCNVILAGDDNLSRITDVIIKCGFYNENIVYNPKSSAEPRGFEVASQPIKSVKEHKLFINNCNNSSCHCAGCGFKLIPNRPYFIYGSTTIQDSNSKMFHVRNSCLKSHFTDDQLKKLTCVTNNNVDISPIDIIKCGIVNIENCK